MNSPILRLARVSDVHCAFDWRNDAHSRAMSNNSEILIFEDHEKWFESSLNNPLRILLVAEASEEKVGILRYDLDGESASAVTSINLNPFYRGRGLSANLLLQSECWLPSTVKKIFAEIKQENIASVKAFEKAGYTICDDSENLKLYVKSLEARKTENGY